MEAIGQTDIRETWILFYILLIQFRNRLTIIKYHSTKQFLHYFEILVCRGDEARRFLTTVLISDIAGPYPSNSLLYVIVARPSSCDCQVENEALLNMPGAEAMIYAPTSKPRSGRWLLQEGKIYPFDIVSSPAQNCGTVPWA